MALLQTSAASAVSRGRYGVLSLAVMAVRVLVVLTVGISVIFLNRFLVVMVSKRGMAGKDRHRQKVRTKV